MATTVTLKPNAIDLSGSTSGTTTLQATAVAGTTTITLPAATDTLVGKATTDTLTNKTLTGAVMNGTLGATTPSTVEATTISASSTATFAAGAVGTPSITTTGDTNTGIFFPAADTIAFSDGGTESMRIDSSGNVGIGTTSQNEKFVVNGAIRSTNNAVGATATADSGLFYFVPTADAPSDPRTILQGVGTAGVGASIAFFTGTSSSNTERMRIDSSGNLLVGETTQRGRISVTTGSDESIFAINSAGGSSATMCSWNSAGSGDNYFHAFFVDTGASNVGNIDYNRAAGLVRYNTTSDATLKNIIGDSDNQKSVEILNTTRIREFAWKSDVEQKPQIGVIAQELHETYKGAVSVGGDIEKTDEEGNVTTEYRPWGVDKTAFTFHLIAGWQAHEKAIQELKAINDTQAETINALTARIVALENK